MGEASSCCAALVLLPGTKGLCGWFEPCNTIYDAVSMHESALHQSRENLGYAYMQWSCHKGQCLPAMSSAMR